MKNFNLSHKEIQALVSALENQTIEYADKLHRNPITERTSNYTRQVFADYDRRIKFNQTLVQKLLNG